VDAVDATQLCLQPKATGRVTCIAGLDRQSCWAAASLLNCSVVHHGALSAARVGRGRHTYPHKRERTWRITGGGQTRVARPAALPLVPSTASGGPWLPLP
jgi:hypothetical protein